MTTCSPVILWPTFIYPTAREIDRLNWLADTSANGMRRYLGVMVNYRYELNQIEQNHERYKSEGVITASSVVRSLAKTS